MIMNDFKIKTLPPRTDITNPSSQEFSVVFPLQIFQPMLCVCVIHILVFHWMNALTVVVIMLKVSVHV